jgi:hypothetical protein
MNTLHISENHRRMLRELGKKVADIASLPINGIRKDLWRRVNGLEKVKPPICIYEIPWNEMDVDGELELKTADPMCRQIEWELRETLYRWHHLQADMVVEPVVYSPLAISNTGFGIREDVDVLKTDETNAVVSRHFKIQLQSEDDLEKIKMPVITHDEARSEKLFLALTEVFGGVLPVRQGGVKSFTFNAWDELVRLTGVQEVLLDLAMRPDFVHKAIGRLTDAYLCGLDQFESLHLLASNNDNSYTTTGGYGYTDELPPAETAPRSLRAADLWGRSMSQIFSEVSPAMHDEFALHYEMKWLRRFGMTYYGCCEPLHRKVDILKKVPNLRKISMSPWVNFEEAVENVGNRYVFSFKPNPAFLAEDTWNPEKVRDDLRCKLAKAGNCVVEVVLKDISTVRHEPQRLWEWAKVADEVTREFA